MLENPNVHASPDAELVRTLRDLASLSLATSKLILDLHTRAGRGTPPAHPWFLENLDRELRLARTYAQLAATGVAEVSAPLDPLLRFEDEDRDPLFIGSADDPLPLSLRL